MKCKHCGKEIANDSKFCEFCGKQLHNKRILRIFGVVLVVVLSVIYYKQEKNDRQELEEQRIADSIAQVEKLQRIQDSLELIKLEAERQVEEAKQQIEEAKKETEKAKQKQRELEDAAMDFFAW